MAKEEIIFPFASIHRQVDGDNGNSETIVEHVSKELRIEVG